MLDLSGNMIQIVDINELLNQFNTVDLRDNPCCYTLYPVWSGCIITGTNNNSISAILLLFITNTLLIVASCFPYIVEYVGEINAYYVRVVRWATLIRRIQRQGIHHRIHPVMQRVFRRAPEDEALQRREQNERVVLIPEHLHPIEALQRHAPEAVHPERVGEARQIPAAQPIEAQQEPEAVHAQQVPEVAEPRRRPGRRAVHAQLEVLQEPEVAEPGRRPQRRAAICARQRMHYMR